MGELLAKPPDVIAFTANSAIPVADGVRELYWRLNEKLPSLVCVEPKTSAYRDFLGSDYEEAETATMTEEIRRLAPLLLGCRSAVVVDQFVCTRRTLLTARRILEKAGVPNVAIHRKTVWHDQADPSHVDRERLSSCHEDFMRSIW